jgi:hypothetical protein
MLEEFNYDTFAQHLHSQFQVAYAAGNSAVAELVEACEKPAPQGYKAFSIVLRGPPAPLLAQGIHRFQHDSLGAFDLFTVPIHQDQHGLYYEAVFNRREEREA